MRTVFSGLTVVAALVLGLTAPLAAEVPVGPHAGAFIAAGEIGKNGSCANDGTGDVDGGYVGLAPVPLKDARYVLQGTAIDQPNGGGSLSLCGRLTSITAGGVGASCLLHKGWDGKGTLRFASKSTWKWLSDLGWKASAGNVVAVTAGVGGAKGKSSATFVGQWQFQTDPASCASKDGGDKVNPGPLVVQGVYEIVPAG